MRAFVPCQIDPRIVKLNNFLFADGKSQTIDFGSNFFKNPVLTGLYAVRKSDLDGNWGKWYESSKAKSEAGKKGLE
jgi:hypothetical protein